MQPSVALLEALAVVLELLDVTLTKPALRVMAQDLARYPERQVLAALDRCRRELKGRLTIADVIERLDDGRPGPEAAWAMLPKNEADSVVWCTEMATAFGIAAPLLEDSPIQARMAFIERYRDELRKARDAGRAAVWIFSPGQDARGREAALLAAAEAGRISPERARELLPHSASPLLIERIEALGPTRLLGRAA